MTAHLPSERDLRCAPELASLAILHAVLDAARLALCVENPDIQEFDERTASPRLSLALQICDRAGDLVALIARYNIALILEREAHFEKIEF